tara:strand:+ start:135 stop:581 length:447 start_codon:yes stop_codon:yes gene_type:complete
MKTYKEFQESLSLAKNLGGRVIGKTPAGRFVRGLALPDKISGTKIPFTKIQAPTNKITKALDVPYQSATDAIGTGPAAPLVFATSMATRMLSPAGKKLNKVRTDTRKNIVKGLEKSGDKNSQFNTDRYMSNFKGVNNKPLYPSPIPKV